MNFVSDQIFRRKNGEQVPSILYIKSEWEYRLIDNNTQQCIGSMVLRMNGPHECIEIESLHNNTHIHGTYKVCGIGTFLVGQAINKSKEIGLHGNVILNAAYGSHLFYYNLGFRPTRDGDVIVLGGGLNVVTNTKLLEEAYEKYLSTKQHINTSYIRALWMCFPPNIS